MLNWCVRSIGDIDHIEYTVDGELNLRVISYFIQSCNPADELYKKHFYGKINKNDFKKICETADMLNRGQLDGEENACDGEGWIITNYDSFGNIIHKIGPVRNDSSKELTDLINMLDRYVLGTKNKKII